MTFTTIALLATGGVGMLGWFFAWYGLAGANRAKVAELDAKRAAAEAQDRALVFETMHAAEKFRASQLQLQLDRERASKQALVDALTKAGSHVGPVLVDNSLDVLYPNGGDQGPDPVPSGAPTAVPGQPAASSTPAAKS